MKGKNEKHKKLNKKEVRTKAKENSNYKTATHSKEFAHVSP